MTGRPPVKTDQVLAITHAGHEIWDLGVRSARPS